MKFPIARARHVIINKADMNNVIANVSQVALKFV